MNTQQTEKGFTIIEVVLVLAIAGLILLMALIAWPALQSGQRDSSRKTDVGTVASSVSTYVSNNKGQFPTTAKLTGTSDGLPGSDGSFSGYVKSVSTNTTSIIVGTKVSSADTRVTVTEGKIVINQSATCGATGAANGGEAQQTLNKGTARQFTVTTYLESGGGTSFCQDS